MTPEQRRPEKEAPEADIQEGHGRSKVRDDELKRIIKQHPQRDEPRVDDVEEGEPPS